MRAIATELTGPALAECSSGGAGVGPGIVRISMKANSGEFVPPTRSFPELAVRTFIASEEGNWQQIASARCVALAGPHREAVTTPALLVVLDLGPDAPQVTVECASDALPGRATSVPEFSWLETGKPGPARRILYGAAGGAATARADL